MVERLHVQEFQLQGRLVRGIGGLGGEALAGQPFEKGGFDGGEVKGGVHGGNGSIFCLPPGMSSGKLPPVSTVAAPLDDQGKSLAGFVPVRWSWQAGQPILDWCDLGGLRLTAPFFAQTVQDAQERSREGRRTGLDGLTGWPEDGPGSRPSGLIFHLSRCGSTLAAQVLAASPENIVLSEPEVMDTVLRAGRIMPGVADHQRVAWLRGLAKAYGQRRFPDERRFFVKFDTWHVLEWEVIHQAFPGVPWVFLYRDPVEILVSQLTEVSGRMLPGPMSAGWLGLGLLEALQTPQEEFCARALGRIAAVAAEAASRDPLALLVNYSQLPGALETGLAPWFGVPLDDADRARMQRTARHHSKSPGRPFTGDTAAKQRLANDGLRRLAEHWVGPAYARLERLRLEREAAAA